MRIKICGITNLEDAINAINAGASALGFVFYEKSPRYVTPKEAFEIVNALPPFVQTVGLFVNEDEMFINEVCTKAKMQLAQIIDDEKKLDFNKIEVKTIEVIRVQSKEDIQAVQNKFVLIDAFVENFGGEGKRVALEWFEGVDCSKMVLAGGLNAHNLKQLKGYNFYGVDVSSGVEAYKGKKEKKKMTDFVKAAYEL